MKKYIDAEKLKELIRKYYTSDAWEQMGICGFINDYADTEDVAPVVHAHWIYSGDEDDYDGYYRNCSFCGHQDYVYTRDNDRNYEEYCPCCGAMMDEEK